MLMDLEQMVHALCMFILMLHPVSQLWGLTIFVAVRGPFLSSTAVHQVCLATHHSTELAALCYRQCGTELQIKWI